VDDGEFVLPALERVEEESRREDVGWDQRALEGFFVAE
jgi:hypothetical protein